MTPRLSLVRLLVLLGGAGALAGSACSNDTPSGDIRFGPMGSLSAASGKGSFRFGVATAATQIEDQNTSTDWYLWTEPMSQGGLGKGADFVGDAIMGYSMATADIALMQSMHLDSYRFSIEWARIEPQRGVIDEAALQHYSDLLDALHAAGIRPLVTIHHFSNPVWVDDPRDPSCAMGSSSTNLCGFGDPVGGPLVVDALAKHATLLAQRFGDRVDEWGTVNEPINYLLGAYGVGQLPPGKFLAGDIFGKFVPVLRDYTAASAAMYDAIKAADTIDADGDGVAASVGLSLATPEWVAAQNNMPSTDPVDVAARDRTIYIFNHMFVDSLLGGTFDPMLDGTQAEPHPEWKGRIDWLGVQYYSRLGVTGSRWLFPIKLTPCFEQLDLGSCLPPLDPTFCVPVVDYEYDPAGIYAVLTDLGARWPSLPLVVTEAGIATDVPQRRPENIVRTLEQIDRARHAGVDVRGYYHWSLTDNFEWNLGFAPHFGLEHVDRTTYARTPTLGAQVLGTIAQGRLLPQALRQQYGGLGPMTKETMPSGPLCKPP